MNVIYDKMTSAKIMRFLFSIICTREDLINKDKEGVHNSNEYTLLTLNDSLCESRI